MKTLLIAGLLVAAVGAGAEAQGRPGQGGRSPAAAMLLARTGELQLTDAQVVRLAAIARRAESRRTSMRAARDSVMSGLRAGTRPDSGTRARLMQRFRADAERLREQEHADRRDAIAVLTPDQQARAWEMATRRGVGKREMRGRAKQMRQMRPMRPMRPGNNQ